MRPMHADMLLPLVYNNQQSSYHRSRVYSQHTNNAITAYPRHPCPAKKYVRFCIVTIDKRHLNILGIELFIQRARALRYANTNTFIRIIMLSPLMLDIIWSNGARQQLILIKSRYRFSAQCTNCRLKAIAEV